MKYLIGILSTLLVLALLTYIVLQLIWEIDLVDPEHINNSLKTLGVLAAGATVLTLTIAFFFRDNQRGYDRTAEGVAQPKRS